MAEGSRVDCTRASTTDRCLMIWMDPSEKDALTKTSVQLFWRYFRRYFSSCLTHSGLKSSL